MNGMGSEQARRVLDLDLAGLAPLFAEASRLRAARHGDRIDLCSIVNAKSGCCGEDCAFCAQSARATSAAPRYPLLGVDELVAAAGRAARAGAHRFSIVTSGVRVEPGPELDAVRAAIRRIRAEVGLAVCASLGCVSKEVLAVLRDAGLERYHHNLETARSHWPRICTTRPYDESVRVVREAREVGLEVCSGGIFGLGETLDQRIELLDELRELAVDAAALNFFVAIPGTPLADADDLTPLACLRIVVAARLMMPRTDIRICGGRERNLRDLQALLPLAGASGIMIGGYLTTPGRPPEQDLRMVRDLGLTPADRPDPGTDPRS